MKNCLIHQPAGIGDILWVQPIVDRIISSNFIVYYPVINLYYDMVKNTIKKNNLVWVSENDNFPLKKYYSSNKPFSEKDDIYIPLSSSYMYAPNCSVMISKYFYTQTPISNWHKSSNIERNKNREDKVFEAYNIDKTKPFSLVNMSYGTPPNSIKRSIPLNLKTNNYIEMNFDLDQKYGINLFDWIGVIESAFEIFTVETSTCFLADKYAKTERLFMYERKPDNTPPIFYNLTNKLYRNPNWTYEII